MAQFTLVQLAFVIKFFFKETRLLQKVDEFCYLRRKYVVLRAGQSLSIASPILDNAIMGSYFMRFIIF